MGAKFINIDLEITTTFDPRNLRKALERKCVVICCKKISQRKWLLAVELNTGGRKLTANSVAGALCRIIESLPPAAKALWLKADNRTFDVGLNANLNRRVIVDLFRPQTILRMGDLRAHLACSVYALELEEEVDKIYSIAGVARRRFPKPARS